MDSLGYYYISALMVLYPVSRIFIRAGMSNAWAALLILPMVGYIPCAAVLAFRKWGRA